VLRQARLPESPVYFSSGTGHQRLYVYTVVYACTQLWKDSKKGGFPAPPRRGAVACTHPGSRRERLPRVMNPQ